MQLTIFQVHECFGFRDSDRVNLSDPSNLIYVLGRNSSGKTSFLTALAHLSPKRIPNTHPNFANFDPSPTAPYLLAEYSVSESDLTADTFGAAFRARMDDLNQGASVTISSKEYGRLAQAWMTRLQEVYEGVIDQFLHAGRFWLLRAGSGEYRFSTNLKFKDSAERRTQTIPAALIEAATKQGVSIQGNNQLLVGGSWQPLRQPTPDAIESLLAQQLPTIALFQEAYSLLDALPDVIKLEHLTTSPGPLTTALVEYLGKPQVERLLNGQNPQERRMLLGDLQTKLTALVDEVNRGRTSSTQLLAIDLDRVDGLQVTVYADGKPSFYRHLSDNTKFLFAYHLYAAVYELQGDVLLFDEPSNGFHATAQEQLLKFLRNLGASGSLVIVSTHSEHLIDPDHLTGIRLMSADKDGYLFVRNKWYAPTSGKGDFQALRPILDAIGLKYGANHLTIRDHVIATEGVTELLYLRAFRTLLGCPDELHIAPATGDDTIAPVVALLISQGLSFKIVVDTIVGKKSAKDKLQASYGIPDASICEVLVPPEFPKAKGSGIEDVFTKTDFVTLLAHVGHTPDADYMSMTNNEYMSKPAVVPKRVVAHKFAEQIGSYKPSDFETATLDNMRRLMEFCGNGDWCSV